MRPSTCRAVAAALVFVLLGGCKDEVALTLDGAGGDAWTFAKPLTGRVDGDCDDIFVESPMGRVCAWREGARFAAVALQREGGNDVRAVCVIRNRSRASPVQHRFVRLADVPKARIRARAASRAERLGPAALTRASPLGSVAGLTTHDSRAPHTPKEFGAAAPGQALARHAAAPL